jgi:hypothetical protein
MTKDFRERPLIVNEDVDACDGTTAVVRSETLSAEDIEFARWRAERWMKVRHLRHVLVRYPRFVALKRVLEDLGRFFPLNAAATAVPRPAGMLRERRAPPGSA